MDDQFSFSMRMRNTCLMCAPVPASPPPLEPPEPALLPDEDASPPPDPEFAPEPDPDVEPPLIDDDPELLLPGLLVPPSLTSLTEEDPVLDPHPPETPSARARPASVVGARSMALMASDVKKPPWLAPQSRTGRTQRWRCAVTRMRPNPRIKPKGKAVYPASPQLTDFYRMTRL
jgi:hypothetical protein